MDPFAAKKKIFDEMQEVAQADRGDALRAKYAPPPMEEEMGEPGGEGMSESMPVPGTEGEMGEEMGAEGEGGDILDGLSEEDLLMLLSGK